ncbi:flavin reductase family protein [Myceligenerans indicum]|uniref:Flavin reductase family protein n=1 Tax=Myceligenerans indicum TaxID=2593663 RepID=A0ABS1LFD9_9MICO|nr:flavin reductase family protein [Myceligenerans indicum]MBL0884961.1 flavin reductase family protein [Myceligenerans indicum]
MHRTIDLKVMYFGTPVVLVSTRNPDGSANLAPMSSAWWLNGYCVLGFGNSARTAQNLRRERECVLNLVPASMVDVVDRLALTTGNPGMSPGKATMGYEYVPDKFARAGLSEQASELVGAPRVAECPIQLEGAVVRENPLGTSDSGATTFHVRVLRSHVADELVLPGTHYVDPWGWDPLVMKFCEFFGGGSRVRPSRLAEAWEMPHPEEVAP